MRFYQLFIGMPRDICILCSLILPKGIITRTMGNRVLAFIGKISFSIYLTHFFIIAKFELYHTLSNLLLTYLLSIGVSVIAYFIIEKPSIIFASTKRIRTVVDYYQHLLR